MEGMSKTVVVIGSMAAALPAVGVLGLVEVLPAEATFPGKNGEIAFQSDRGGSYEIYTMNRNGTKIDKLTTNPAPDEDPAFSPDGKKIIFMSDRDGDSDIYKMTANGTKEIPLTTNRDIDEDPAFSPNGKRIVFRSNRDDNSDIYTMNADRTERTRLVPLTTDPATTFGADWAVR